MLLTACCCDMQEIVSNTKKQEFLKPQSQGNVPSMVSTLLIANAKMSRQPSRLSEFIIDSHTIGNLLAELIGPAVVIYKGPLELAQDLEAEILEMHPRSPVSLCVS